MKKSLLTCTFAALALVSMAASSETVVTKIGKISISQVQAGGTNLRLGRADGGNFAGCSVEPQFVAVIRPLNPRGPLSATDALALALSAKQNNYAVRITYTAVGTGSCVLRSLELQ